MIFNFFQIEGSTGKLETFNKLLQDSINTALELKKLGYKKGDIVGICSYNHLDSAKPFIAAAFLGLQIASFDPTLSLDDTVHLMKQVTPKIIFISDNAIELIQKAINEVQKKVEIVIFGTHENMMPFSKFLEHHSGEQGFTPEQNIDCLDVAVIIFSSGTTGTPKGICLTHRGLEYESFMTNKFLTIKGISQKYQHESASGVMVDPVLYFASSYWISTILFLCSSLMEGYTRILCKFFKTQWAWDYLQKYKVNTAFFAPCQIIDMIESKPKDAIVSHLKDILTAGSNISEDQICNAQKAFPNTNIIQGCGQTEVSGFYTIFRRDEPEDLKLMKRKPKSCGKVIPGFTYKIVDPETEAILGANKCGELRVKSDTLLKGYYNLECSDIYDSEGFLKTGDVMYYDEDLCFYHVDRIKEMLKYKAWHVAPATLESILHKHPAVQNAVVVGLPHPRDGDHPLAFVILNKKHLDSVADDILNYVNNKVDERHQLRGGLLFIDSLPLTPSGKVKRRILRDKAIALKNQF